MKRVIPCLLPTDTFAGYCRKTDVDFLKDCRAVLRGTGFHVWVRGRAENRRQHAPSGCGWRYYSQSLPVEFATYLGVYVRAADSTRATISTRHAADIGLSSERARNFDRILARYQSEAVGRVKAVFQIWAAHGKAIAPDLNARVTRPWKIQVKREGVWEDVADLGRVLYFRDRQTANIYVSAVIKMNQNVCVCRLRKAA